MSIPCTEERHSLGGPGEFYLGKAETLLPELIKAYGGTVQLIYLDPPFGTGDTFHLRVNAGKRSVSMPAYTDKLTDTQYMDWMRVILSGCHKLLSPTGCLYLHVDYRMCAKLRLLLDQLFGRSNFMNEIIWCYRSGGRSKNYFPRKHDNILFYRKSRKVFFNLSAVGVPRGRERRNHMKRVIDETGRVGYSIRSAGKTYTYYEGTPVYPTDVWTDIEHLQQKDTERTGYATQKPEALLERIVRASSNPGDLVMDLFSGGGTTAAVCARLNRRFVVTDASPFALYTLRARLLKSASTPSLLDGDHALRLIFPAQEKKATLSCSIRYENGRAYADVASAAFDRNHPLVYAALGAVTEGCFHAFVTELSPRLPFTMPIGSIKKPVLHIVDTLGNQAFYPLKED